MRSKAIFSKATPIGIRRDFPLPDDGIKCQDWVVEFNLKPLTKEKSHDRDYRLGHRRKSKRAANRAVMPDFTKSSAKSASSHRRYYITSYLIK